MVTGSKLTFFGDLFAVAAGLLSSISCSGATLTCVGSLDRACSSIWASSLANSSSLAMSLLGATSGSGTFLGASFLNCRATDPSAKDIGLDKLAGSCATCRVPTVAKGTMADAVASVVPKKEVASLTSVWLEEEALTSWSALGLFPFSSCWRRYSSNSSSDTVFCLLKSISCTRASKLTLPFWE